MKIKSVNFTEAVKRIGFIKNINKIQAKKFLTDRNVIESDDVFIVLDSEMNLGIMIHTYGSPKEMKIYLK